MANHLLRPDGQGLPRLRQRLAAREYHTTAPTSTAVGTGWKLTLVSRSCALKLGASGIWTQRYLALARLPSRHALDLAWIPARNGTKCRPQPAARIPAAQLRGVAPSRSPEPHPRSRIGKCGPDCVEIGQ